MLLPDGFMAICFRCGGAKPRALDTCASCGSGPRTKRDYLVSTALSRFLSTDDELARYRDELQHATGPAALAIQDKIGHWTAYRTFNEYTLGELEGETLDDWLE